MAIGGDIGQVCIEVRWVNRKSLYVSTKGRS